MHPHPRIRYRSWGDGGNQHSRIYEYDPKEDAIFTQALRKRLEKGIDVLEVDANMEDLEFAKAVVKATLEVLE